MRNALTIAFVMLMIGLGGWAFYHMALVASRGGEDTPLYSSRRFDPYGTAALFRLLRERPNPVTTLENPNINRGHRGVLIQTLPINSNRYRVSEDEEVEEAYFGYGLPTENLAGWIAEGNTVIQLTRHYTPLMKRLGVPSFNEIDDSADDDSDAGATTNAQATNAQGAAQSDEEAAEPFVYNPNPYSLFPRIQKHQLAGKAPGEQPGSLLICDWERQTLRQLVVASDRYPGLILRAPRRFPSVSKQHDRWRVLATIDQDAVAGVIEHGEGRLIVIGAPTAALNHTLGEGGNLRFLLDVAGDRPVILDDWSHGIGRTDTMMDLIKRFGLLPFLAQIALMVVVYHMSTRGFRRVDRAASVERAGGVHQITTLAYLYSQALSTEQVLGRVSREIRRRLAGTLRCAPGELEERLTSHEAYSEIEAADILEKLGSTTQAAPRQRAAQTEHELCILLTRTHELAREYPS